MVTAEVKDIFAGEHRMRSGVASLKRFKRHPANERTHPPAEIELLARVLKERGPDQPIVVDEKWVILKGHGRLDAAEKAELASFPYVMRSGLSDVEKDAIRVEDNALPLLAGWDKGLLQATLVKLEAAGYDMKLLGFGQTELVSFMTTPPAPEEFASFTENNIETEYCCPKCHYRWSGKPS